ncbi:hypothetical protein OsI_34304 [Oryza sativa Indica Group]|uniref:Uncharacterized protein n=1 Tax=Oryza sativa subsp. indica TaxID=39946 RepID=B8BHV5_ORYSI|nr:hypothetical protein OsI_34304 [Oryza sativa Indica Group]
MADTDDELDPVIVAGANRAFTDNERKLGVGAGVIINHHRLSSRLPPMANLILVIVAGADRFSTADRLSSLELPSHHYRYRHLILTPANAMLVPTTSTIFTSTDEAEWQGGRSLYEDDVTNTSARTNEAVDRCRRPHTSTPPSPSCMGEREAKTNDDQHSLIGGFSRV